LGFGGKMKHNPKGIGEKSEAQILALLLKHEFNVLIPFGDNQRYDFVIENSGAFIRVQCKTGRLNKGCIEFSTCSNNWYTKEKKSYYGEADIFAVYVPNLDKTHIANVNAAPKVTYMLRLDPDNCRQKRGVNRAEDYLFVPGKSLLSYP
jgi:hypothetical protein